ncbi:hypothetical protein SOVF_094010 [Spinacia oleracea]|nr:hypothetical protein SOVF_094010 [Spinacia oleracea]
MITVGRLLNLVQLTNSKPKSLRDDNGYYVRNLNKLQYPSFLVRVNNASLKVSSWKEEQAIVSFPNGKAFQEEATEDGGNTKEEDDLDSLDGLKMIRVCDKLIEVFLLDKPSATDWRRLLTFSKEWSCIRPHFFLRCEERADSEDNPEMKHKLLRLGRKLREIDVDVQRNNELLEVARGASKNISEVVARRRKDFTKEFFEHLHTVAESYFDNPVEQNG